MLPRERRYLLVTCCIGSGIVNAIINGGLGWGLTHTYPILPLWRIPGVVADIAGTAFGVTFGTCLGMVLQIRRDLKAGRVGHVDASVLSPGVAALVARFPAGILKRSVGLGALSVPIFALPVTLGLAVLGIASMNRVPFVTLKAGFAALQAAMVTPLIALAALADVSRKVNRLEAEPEPSLAPVD
jgi:hypothetical protein